MTVRGVPSTRVDQFKEALSRWASGVTVVTTADGGRDPHGFTATSFTAASLAPPMVLVCLDRSAACLPAFLRSDWLAVHLLRRAQQPLAERFARKGTDKFAGLRTRSGLGGVPLLDGALAVLECGVAGRFDAGDHVVLLAEVRRSATDDGEPLLHHRRGFRGLD
ncbi:flavin reductase family protein [Actinosynnema sp. NPDC051121]